MDILEIRPNDTEAIGALVDLMHKHCDPEQCEQFLTDLSRWNRHHATTMKALERSPEWQEIEQWRQFILSLAETDRSAA